MCGAHAQVQAAAELSVGLRLAGATRADVRHALWTERSLVKTFGPRGTVHLLPARDLALWAGALAAIPGAASGLPEHSGLTAGQLDEVIAAIAGALAAAELTIDELSEAVIGAAGPWAADPVVPGFGDMWPRWRQALPLAGARGMLCFGPGRARRVTYTSPRRWQPGFRPLEGPAAVPELARRYLHAYGPATPQHFARWLGAPRPWAGQVFAALAGELQQVDLEGTPAWQLAADAGAGPAAGPPRGVRLLPYFDAYAVAGQPRPLLFPGAAAGAWAAARAGAFPVLLIDGTVGVWHQRRSGRRIAITVEPLRALTAARRRELGEQAERVGAILEGRAELTIGAVSVGAHA